MLYLFLKLRKTRARAALSLLGMGGLWCALVLLYNLNVFAHLGIRVFNMPEINTFCLLGVFEICIRNRLFPYNENYTGFFSRLSVPVLITDRKFDPAYHTAVPVTADKAFLEASLAGPVYPREDLRLSGMPIQAGAGCAFWEEDEQALHRQRRRLASANELLGAENELIEAGNRMKEQKARLDAQNLVYDRIAEALYPKQKQIEALLSDVKPETEEFRKRLGHDWNEGEVQSSEGILHDHDMIFTCSRCGKTHTEKIEVTKNNFWPTVYNDPDFETAVEIEFPLDIDVQPKDLQLEWKEGKTGTLTISATGGRKPYKYKWIVVPEAPQSAAIAAFTDYMETAGLVFQNGKEQKTIQAEERY